MKATGEVMSLGRTIEESLLKAVRSLEIGAYHIELEELTPLSDDEITYGMIHAQDDRLFYVSEAIRRGFTIYEVADFTKIDVFFLDKLLHIIEVENQIKENKQEIEILKEAKQLGFSDVYIADKWEMSVKEVYDLRKELNIFPVYKMVDTCAAEFASKTPYFYGTYEIENESIKSEKESIIVLGSGPIRIGQGVEFDYATVHSVRAIQDAGYEAIIMNSNPETVSTDFSISDKLYFEPLTLEDVMHVIELEQPKGVIVQFGGQTAINLAEGLTEHGVQIIGTTIEDLDRAENRDKFEQALKELGIPQPEGATATNTEDAIVIAERIKYPVLVRPSYVLGGRAMEIVWSTNDLKRYMKEAVKASPEHPVLIDRYLVGTECEVDAICDGDNVLLPGIMEHIERAGVHSGDSMAVYPPQNLSEEVIQKIVDYTKKLALGLNCKGMMNVQFIAQESEVYVIEVNPRASRTVPFLSKVTGIPMAQVATKCILGQKLTKLGYEDGLYKTSELVHVKAPVFSFAKLQEVDTQLGPEMKSTGEVMGTDKTLEKALYKAFEASGMHLPNYGSVLFTIADESKDEALQLAMRFSEIGYGLVATEGTGEFFRSHGLEVKIVSKLNQNNQVNVLDMIRLGQTQLVINTTGNESQPKSDGFKIRRVSVENGVPLMTSLDTADAILKVLEDRNFSAIAL